MKTANCFVTICVVALATAPAAAQNRSDPVGDAVRESLQDAPAQNLDIMGVPTYGTVNLEAGFADDPNTTTLAAGGNVSAESAIEGGECVGFIASTPDLRLNYTAGEFPLSFMAIAESDTTLVINGPDGQWHCDDDSATESGLDPFVMFTNPTSGQYDIWVGSYQAGEYGDATLYITELARD